VILAKQYLIDKAIIEAALVLERIEIKTLSLRLDFRLPKHTWDLAPPGFPLTPTNRKQSICFQVVPTNRSRVEGSAETALQGLTLYANEAKTNSRLLA
jgi:hypothetical protein